MWISFESLNLTKLNNLDTTSILNGLNTSSIDFGPADDHWEDEYARVLSPVTKARIGILFVFMVLGIPSNALILAVSIINKRKQPNSAYLLMNMVKGSNHQTSMGHNYISCYCKVAVRVEVRVRIRLGWTLVYPKVDSETNFWHQTGHMIWPISHEVQYIINPIYYKPIKYVP